MKCWGGNESAQVGNGVTSFRVDTPTALALDGVVHIGAGGYHTCALRGDGSAYCWGYGFYGEIGDGVHDRHLTPTPVAF